MDKKPAKSRLSEIPVDVIPNILTNLPLKSLCRYKCVSKTWCSLVITNFHNSQRRPVFARLCPNFPGFQETYSGFRIYSIDGNGFTSLFCTSMSPPKFAIDMSHCNGLFCFKDLDRGYALGVCNPITQEEIILPEYNRTTLLVNLLNTIGFEFVFDPLSAKYKMLNLMNYPYCEIFTLGTTSWRLLHLDGVDILRECGRPTTNSICIGSTLYLYCETTNKIISFQLASESVEAIEGPKRVKPISGRSRVRYLFELEGCLCLVDWHTNMNKLDLWMLKDGYGTNIVGCRWVLLTTVVPPSEDTMWIEPYSTRTGEIVIAEDSDAQGILYFYSFLTHQFETIKVVGLPSDFTLENYVENHVSLQDL